MTFTMPAIVDSLLPGMPGVSGSTAVQGVNSGGSAVQNFNAGQLPMVTGAGAELSNTLQGMLPLSARNYLTPGGGLSKTPQKGLFSGHSLLYYTENGALLIAGIAMVIIAFAVMAKGTG